jgi:hypothetical protein
MGVRIKVQKFEAHSELRFYTKSYYSKWYLAIKWQRVLAGSDDLGRVVASLPRSRESGHFLWIRNVKLACKNARREVIVEDLILRN